MTKYEMIKLMLTVAAKCESRNNFEIAEAVLDAMLEAGMLPPSVNTIFDNDRVICAENKWESEKG